MRVLTIVWLVTDLIFLALWQPVLGDDAWYNQLRSDYKYQKRSLDRQRDRREDCLESLFESAKEQLELERREALRKPHSDARQDIVSEFHARKKSLEDKKDRDETALDLWYDRSRDMLRDQYDTSKDWLRYREQIGPEQSEPPARLVPVHVPAQHRHVRPQSEPDSNGYSTGHRRAASDLRPGTSWIFRVR